MIEFVTGNFFDYDADIRVNTVNCVGVMGAGVALMYKKKFPTMFKEYYKACKENKVKPGAPHIWMDINLVSSLTIINFPTKIHWKNPSEYEYIEKGLIWLRKFLLDKNNSTVTLPALGCGHGGLDWEKVKSMIEEYLGDINARILVFEPSSSNKIYKSEAYEEELIRQDIHKLLPNDKFYPSKLVGRSAIEIYSKGNIELIRSKNITILLNSKSTIREKDAILRVINELPRDRFVFLLGLSNSYEIDLAKEVLSKDFKVVFVIPYGILQLKVRKDLEEFWNYKNIAVLSAASPNQIWKKYESINSLKLRLKISNITLINSQNIEFLKTYAKYIIESDSKNFYINYWNTKIDFFDSLMAQKIGISQKTKKPNALPLLRILDQI
jgi:O-acetyl-ADP-ribose deacetylase (regulator of RNase III)